MTLEEKFYKRLRELRTQKNVSARDMSLSLGKSAGYINKIEKGHCLLSMESFFCICEYLNISPKDFFDFEMEFDFKMENPEQLNDSIAALRKLTPEHLKNISDFLKYLT